LASLALASARRSALADGPAAAGWRPDWPALPDRDGPAWGGTLRGAGKSSLIPSP
jgi:hypothetical protein